MRCSHPTTALSTAPHPPGSAPHALPPNPPPRSSPSAQRAPSLGASCAPWGRVRVSFDCLTRFSQSPAGVGLHRDYPGLPARAGIPGATRRALAAPPRSSTLQSSRPIGCKPRARWTLGNIAAATRWVLDGGTPPCLRGHIAPRLCTPPCRPLACLGRDFWAFAGARRCDTCRRRDGARRRASKKRAFRPASGQRATL